MKHHVILTAAVLSLLTVRLEAAVVYDNLSASSGATSGGSAGANTASGGLVGDSFSTGTGVNLLSDVKLLLDATSPADGGTFTVSLFSSTGSNTPGSLLSTLGTFSDSQLSSSLQAFDVPVSAFSLSPSTRYWIELSGSSAGSVRWSYDNTNVGVGVANEYNYFSGSSYANSAFTPYQMTVTTSAGTVTPEPTTMALTALGFCGLALIRRRQIR